MTFDEFKDEFYDAIQSRGCRIASAVIAETAAKYECDPKVVADIVADNFDEYHAAMLIGGSPADFVSAVKSMVKAGARVRASRIDIEEIAARELWQERCDAEGDLAERLAEKYGVLV